LYNFLRCQSFHGFYLLHSCQALELCAAEVLLLQGCCLQHEVLLLCGIHLLQILSCCAGLPVQGLLDHLRRVQKGPDNQLVARHVPSVVMPCQCQLPNNSKKNQDL
jgi:hypothetical protein